MTLSVVFRREARREFDEAALWYDKHRPGLGSQFIGEIDHAIALAREDPRRSCTVMFGAFECVAFPIPSFSAQKHGVLSC